MVAVRNFGQLPGQHFLHAYLGGNYKMTDLCAAIGCAQLGKIDGYIELMRASKPEDARYLANHRGHLMFVKPEEKKFVTAKMIAETSFTATEAEIKKRIEALKAAGYRQFTIQLVPGQEKAIEDWGKIRRAFA